MVPWFKPGLDRKKREFVFHKYLLCSAAAYFRAALDGNLKEAQEQSIEMPEDDPEVFMYFQLWFYTGSILEAHETEKVVEEWILIKLYTFAEALGIVRFQNAAIDLLIDQMAVLDQINPRHLHYIYANTSENSLLRQLFIDEMVNACILHERWLDETRRDSYPTNFLFGLIQALSEKLGPHKLGTKHFRSIRSKYHTELPTSSLGGAQREGIA